MEPQSCPVAHKSENAVLGYSGRVCAVVPAQLSSRNKGGGIRSEVKGWSAASRRRLLFGLGTLDFEGELRRHGGRWLSTTYTYVEDPGPEAFRRHRLQLLDALRYRLGERRLVWKVEFQRRGVVHLHIMQWVPWKSESNLRGFRRWQWAQWERITGTKARVDARWTTARMLATYMSADFTRSGKGYQYRVPPTWQHTGRWWAIVGMKARWTTRKLREPEFVVLQRTLRRHRQANSDYKIRCGRSRRPGKAWVLVSDPKAMQQSLSKFLATLEVGP